MHKYIIGLIVVLLFMIGFEIESGKINFGSSYWNDTTSALMSNNKGLRINGDIHIQSGDSLYYNGTVVTSGTGTVIDTTKYFSIYRLDTTNIGFLNQTNSWTQTNEFTSVSISTSLENIGSTTLADVTISGNANISGNNDVTGYSTLGSGGPSMKMKLVKFKAPASTGSYGTQAHSLGSDSTKVISWQAMMRDANTGGTYITRNNATANVDFQAYLDNTNCAVWLTGSNLTNDSVYFLITLRQ